MMLAQLAGDAVKTGASDLHLSPDMPPMLRLHGDLLPQTHYGTLSSADISQLLSAVMSAKQQADLKEFWELDFALTFAEHGRFRANAYHTHRGIACALRPIPATVPPLEKLGAPAILAKLAELDKGLVLVTGATGSGKSTTLASMIDYINRTKQKHIVTIEDPLEFVHQNKKSLINHREVGQDTRSFAQALKSALRQNPNVILVGELRDHETISLALTAAETGHLVLATLHTSSAAKTIDRIIDVFSAGDKEMIRTMLSGSLQAVIAQVLVRKADGQGRVAAHEIMIATPAIRNLIRENKVAQIGSMMQTGVKYGMQTLKDSLQALVGTQKITPEAMTQTLNILNQTEDDKLQPGGMVL